MIRFLGHTVDTLIRKPRVCGDDPGEDLGSGHTER